MCITLGVMTEACEAMLGVILPMPCHVTTLGDGMQSRSAALLAYIVECFVVAMSLWLASNMRNSTQGAILTAAFSQTLYVDSMRPKNPALVLQPAGQEMDPLDRPPPTPSALTSEPLLANFLPPFSLPPSLKA